MKRLALQVISPTGYTIQRNGVASTLGGLSGPRRIPCRLSGHRNLPFADWRSTENDLWVHHGQSTTQSHPDGHFVLCIIQVCNHVAWPNGRDLHLWDPVYYHFPGRARHCVLHCRAHYSSVALSAEARQHQWCKSVFYFITLMLSLCNILHGIIDGNARWPGRVAVIKGYVLCRKGWFGGFCQVWPDRFTWLWNSRAGFQSPSASA